ncbi:MAG: class I adenylate-forming enzyme family protein [Pseudomonadota bacterium]
MTTWQRIPLDEIPAFDRLFDYVRHYAGTQPDAEACVDLGGRRVTYAGLATEVEAMRASLIASGVEPGDVVGLLAHPCLEFFSFFLAVAEMGAVFLGLNPKYTDEEIARIADLAQPVRVFLPQELEGREFDEMSKELGSGRSSDVKITQYQVGVLREALDRSQAQTGAVRTTPGSDAPCALVFTSGSSGTPKGALLKQSGFVACSRTQAHHYGRRGARTFNALPINHVGSLCDTATTLMILGGCQIFTPFDTAKMVAAIGPERIDTLGGVPTMLQLMVMEPAFQSADLTSLKRILWSGAPMPRALGRRLKQLGLPMHNFYGMTETTGSIAFTEPDASFDDLVGTIGKPHRDYQVRIGDPSTGQPLSTGETGEIQTKSPGVFHSYLGDEEATQNAFTIDGWFKTGDLASQREDGSLALAGRLKEMFKSGGYNVYPREVEAVLEGIDGVAVAAVVPVPDPTFHEVGYAFYVPASAEAVGDAALKQAASEKLANYKIPKRFIPLLDPPLLPSGKIDKGALKDRGRAVAQGEAP